MLEDLAGEIAARGLIVTLDLAVAEIMSERQGLQEAVANLLSNAVKFSPAQGGTITVRSYRDADEVLVSVADRGVGFDMQYHDRIFGIFERLHRQEDYPGTGVGLAIVRKVAERHGGRAWAESAPGQGSTFFLAFSRPALASIRPPPVVAPRAACYHAAVPTTIGPGTPSSSLAQDATLSRSRSRVRIPPGSPHTLEPAFLVAATRKGLPGEPIAPLPALREGLAR